MRPPKNAQLAPLETPSKSWKDRRDFTNVKNSRSNDIWQTPWTFVIRDNFNHESEIGSRPRIRRQRLNDVQKGWHNLFESKSDNSSKWQSPRWWSELAMDEMESWRVPVHQMSTETTTDKDARISWRTTPPGGEKATNKSAQGRLDYCLFCKRTWRRHCGVQFCSWAVQMCIGICRSCTLWLKVQTQF